MVRVGLVDKTEHPQPYSPVIYDSRIWVTYDLSYIHAEIISIAINQCYNEIAGHSKHVCIGQDSNRIKVTQYSLK